MPVSKSSTVKVGSSPNLSPVETCCVVASPGIILVPVTSLPRTPCSTPSNPFSLSIIISESSPLITLSAILLPNQAFVFSGSANILSSPPVNLIPKFFKLSLPF